MGEGAQVLTTEPAMTTKFFGCFHSSYISEWVLLSYCTYETNRTYRPSCSTSSLIKNAYANIPTTSTPPATMNAAANDFVTCARYPVNAGAIMPPTVPPKFCMPVTDPTIFFSQTACVKVHVFGDEIPSPHSEMVSNQTAANLLKTSPAGTIKHPIAKPTIINQRLTSFSARPRLTSQSLKKPDAIMMADIGR